MEHDGYAPPRAEIADVSSTSVETPLFAVSMVKLIVLNANRINAKLASGRDPNARFGWANIVWIVLGSLFFALALVGLFMAAGEQARGAPALRAVNRMSAGPAGNCGSR
jgi:hypothetical protein